MKIRYHNINNIVLLCICTSNAQFKRYLKQQTTWEFKQYIQQTIFYQNPNLNSSVLYKHQLSEQFNLSQSKFQKIAQKL